MGVLSAGGNVDELVHRQPPEPTAPYGAGQVGSLFGSMLSGEANGAVSLKPVAGA